MEPNKGEESGEMYSPDDQGEYMPEAHTLNFSVQGLSDALTALDTEVTMVQPLSEEFALLLKVTMADHPGHPCPPTFSWNVERVMHILKGDPTWGTSSMYKWMALAWPTCSLTNKAAEDSLWMLLRPSGPMWGGGHLLSGSPALHTLLSFPFHWKKVGTEQLQLQSSANKGPGWSIKATPC